MPQLSRPGTGARSALRLALALGAALWFAAPSRAAVVFNLNTPINGDVPVKADPALPFFAQVVFENGTNPGEVKMTLRLNSIGGQFAVNWLFNTASNITATSLNFAYQAGDSTGPDYAALGKSNSQTLNGASSVKAGLFNLNFEFQVPQGTGRFEGTEVSVFTVTGDPDLDENSFTATSADGGGASGAGGWLSAVRFQGIGDDNEGSGSVGTRDSHGPAAIPAPAGLVLSLVGAGSFGGLAGAGWLRRRLGRS